VTLGLKDAGQTIVESDDESQKDLLLNDFWTIIDRIKRYPGVEYLSVSEASSPYSGSWMTRGFFIDSIKEYYQIKSVTPDFFNVYKIDIEKGRIFNWDSSDEVMISANDHNEFLKKEVLKLDTVNYGEQRDRDHKLMNVVGVTNRSKRSEFDSYGGIVYLPWKKNDRGIIGYISATEISIRLKPGTQKDFVENFTKNMQEQISVGPYFLTSVQSLETAREEYMLWTNISNNMKSIFSITAFILINIFLAIMGTFWFRIQARRSEIGLRIALGSTKINIKKILIGEASLLLFLSSIIGTIICINISATDVLGILGIPQAKRDESVINFSQYFIDYSFTFLFLAFIIVFAIWYPAQKAAKIPPAIALKDE